jgi:hypothetical protein
LQIRRAVLCKAVIAWCSLPKGWKHCGGPSVAINAITPFATSRLRPSCAGSHTVCAEAERRPTEAAYFVSHHQSEKATAVVQVEIASDIPISFAHSQFDTNALPVALPVPTIADPGTRYFRYMAGRLFLTRFATNPRRSI